VAVAGLLAGLVLTTVLPSPAAARLPLGGGAGAPAEERGATPDESGTSEREAPPNELGLHPAGTSRPRRRPAAHGPLASKLLAPWTVAAAHRPPSERVGRFDADGGPDGHFLDRGRALRHWFQSQTC
jgi:hypothetical protein